MHGTSARDEKDMADTLFNEFPGDVIREAYHLPAEHSTSGSPKKG
jgi:hypothetical protein